MGISIKINTANMVRHLLNKTITDIKNIYEDDMYWFEMSDAGHKRRLAISNMDKFEHWIHKLDDEELVELCYKPGVLNMLDKFKDVMFTIIQSEDNKWIWKPRYILSLMILMSYVVEYDWCNKHHTGVIARGIMKCDTKIRVGEYFREIHKSEYRKAKIREIFNSIVFI